MFRFHNALSGALVSVFLLLIVACNNEPSVFDRGYNNRMELVFRETTAKLDTGYDLSAVHYLDSALSQEQAIRIDHRVQKYKLLAEFYTHKRVEYAVALKYLDSLDEIAATPYDANNHIKIFSHMLRGRIAVAQRNYDEAFHNYYKGKLLVDESINDCTGAQYAHSLGYLFFQDASYQEAAGYYHLAFLMGSACDQKDFITSLSQRQLSLNNVGVCYERLGLLDSALWCYRTSMDFVLKKEGRFLPDKSFPIRKIKGVLLGNIGGVLLKQKKYDEAERNLKASIEINYNPLSDIRDAILTRIKLADLYLQTNRQELCEKLIGELEADNKNYPNLDAETRVAELKYRLYRQTKRYEQSLENLNTYAYLKDSLQRVNFGNKRKSNLLIQFENQKSKLALDLLHQENSTKTWYLVFAAVISVLGFIITLLLWFRRQQQLKHIRKLQELNDRIKQNNITLLQSMESLEKSQEENTRIMRIVAHDLRSPISGILGMMDLLKSNALDPEETARGLDLVEKSGKDALNFINDVLHVNVDRNALSKKETDLAELIHSCIQLHNPVISQKSLTTQLQTFPVTMLIDREKIWRVFNNLLSNAVKFSNPHTTILVKMSRDTEKVQIAIQDEGIGIPENLRDKLFDMFSGAGRPGTGGEQSFGLGLAIARQIIVAHGGTIRFESETGKGTTFFVELPLS